MSTMTCDGGLPAIEAGQPRPAVVRTFIRPDAEDLSEVIPVFFIGRNKRGHWVARGADGKYGGLFWRKQSAIRFAAQSAWPARCATIFPSETIELDLENQGNPLLAHVDVTRMLRITGAATTTAIMMAILAGTIAVKTAIFLSRLHY